MHKCEECHFSSSPYSASCCSPHLPTSWQPAPCGEAVKRSILVQTTVVVFVTALVALPIGVVAGRWTWRFTARWLGTSDDAALPLAALTSTSAILVASGLVIAAISGQRAARQPVQQSLMAD